MEKLKINSKTIWTFLPENLIIITSLECNISLLEGLCVTNNCSNNSVLDLLCFNTYMYLCDPCREHYELRFLNLFF